MNYTIKDNSGRKEELIQIRGKIELQHTILTEEICMNYHHFIIEEQCCLRKYYVKERSYQAGCWGKLATKIPDMRNETKPW